MKLAIIGGRDFNDYARLCRVMETAKTPITMIVSGGAIGADMLGAKWADEHDVAKEIFLPDWKNLGKKAGFIRNQQIIDNADAVLAFWNKVSKGTEHSISLANKKGLPMKIVYY